MGLRVGILGSTRGTALQGVLDAVAAGTLDVEIVLVVSNRPEAAGLAIASYHGYLFDRGRPLKSPAPGS